MKIDISVLVPVYRSEKSLAELYSRVSMVLNSIGLDFEFILVDDCSPDQSFAVMQSLRQQDPRVKIIQLESNFGQHNATFCGLKYCQGEFILTMDDDLQHQPEEIPKLLVKIQEGFDVVMGIPLKRQSAFYKDWGSILVDKCLNMIYHKPAELRMSSFRIMRWEMVQKIITVPLTNIYIGALILSHNPRLANVNIVNVPRKYGQSNYSIKKSAQLAWTLLSGYSDLPLQLVSRLWQLTLFLSTVLTLMAIWLREIDLTTILGSLIVLISLLNLISFQLLKGYIVRTKPATTAAKPAYIIRQMEL